MFKTRSYSGHFRIKPSHLYCCYCRLAIFFPWIFLPPISSRFAELLNRLECALWGRELLVNWMTNRLRRYWIPRGILGSREDVEMEWDWRLIPTGLTNLASKGRATMNQHRVLGLWFCACVCSCTCVHVYVEARHWHQVSSSHSTLVLKSVSLTEPGAQDSASPRNLLSASKCCDYRTVLLYPAF